MKKLLMIFLLVFSTAKVSLAGDSVIFIHGLVGNANSWAKQNIPNILSRDGWQIAGGAFYDYRYGIYLKEQAGIGDKNLFLLTIPSRASIRYQAKVVEDILERITELAPEDNLHLVGHSAGGVVARLIVVNRHFPQIKSLITIATPHFGTRRAEMALDLVDLPFPLNLMAETSGGREYDEFQDTKDLFRDLVRPRPGTFLHWLNWQPHPDINYYSIVRKQKSVVSQDFMVPSLSQNMALLPMLHNRTKTYFIGHSHFLNAKDGFALKRILRTVAP